VSVVPQIGRESLPTSLTGAPLGPVAVTTRGTRMLALGDMSVVNAAAATVLCALLPADADDDSLPAAADELLFANGVAAGGCGAASPVVEEALPAPA